MKELQQYTYTIPANGSVQIPASNDNFIVQASTGPLSVRGNTFGRLRGLVAGQGLKAVPFERLELFDESGAPNTVTLLMSPAEFVNQTFSGSVVIVGTVPVELSAADLLALGRPELPTGNWSSSGLINANTAAQIFSAASNVNGAIVWMAEASEVYTANFTQSFIAKATAPANCFDGEIVSLAGVITSIGGPIITVAAKVVQPQRIAPGLGFYFISSAPSNGVHGRAARYTLL